ncbi:MAG: phosphoribosylamine--glycine ligase [Bdellovibrionales bacterium]|nr:phosphoribosylamine--glycine ligase [Bdellovibrionales bacterium]
MNVLVVGSGAREHAICWKLRQSVDLKELWVAPGNPGMARVANPVNISVDDMDGLLRFVRERSIDFVVVGPELPLTLGITDYFEEAGIAIFGPCKAAAMLEGSKSFAKEIMKAAGVPTADYKEFINLQEAQEYIREIGAPIVVKADGLAAGKGVFVCLELDQALEACRKLFTEIPKPRIVIESYLSGTEASFIVATNGSIILPLASSHDYKRIYDRDQGPNTGGMGSVCPTPRMNAVQEQKVIDEVIRPVLRELEVRRIPFCGFLYAGLMLSPDGGISVLEFNARLGDPECQSIMRRMKGDLLKELLTLCKERGGKQQIHQLDWSDEVAVCVVLAAEGYPESPTLGDSIEGLMLAESVNGVELFHAGTKLSGRDKLVTSGGRVMSVTALGADLSSARQRAYQAVDLIQFRGRQVRRDIGS